MDFPLLGSSSRLKRWRIALIVLLAVGLAPVLSVVAYNSVDSLNEGTGYVAADIPGVLLVTLAVAAPFVLLGACAVWTKRKLGLIAVTVSSLMVVALGCAGYWVVWHPTSSTAALVFLYITPVQWVAAIVAAIIVTARGNQ
jgi:hypothetical protein